MNENKRFDIKILLKQFFRDTGFVILVIKFQPYKTLNVYQLKKLFTSYDYTNLRFNNFVIFGNVILPDVRNFHPSFSIEF